MSLHSTLEHEVEAHGKLNDIIGQYANGKAMVSWYPGKSQAMG